MKLLRHQGGNALIEVALFLPILITMFLGVLDFGLLVQQYMIVVDSTRAAAEAATVRSYAVINSGNTAFLALVATNSAQNIANYTATVTNYCTCGPSNGSAVTCGSYIVCGGYGIPAQYVKVVATASLPLLFGLNGFPAIYSVHATSIARTAWTGTQ